VLGLSAPVLGNVGRTVLNVAEDSDNAALSSDIVELTTVVRRVVARRMDDADAVDDLVQETLARVLGARSRLDEQAVGPYAIVTARNLVASFWRRADAGRRHEHRLFDPSGPPAPDEPVVQGEESAAVRMALDRLQPGERAVLVAHEVDGQDTSSLAESIGSTPGAVAARLSRSRAKLRVEYLLALAGDPPSSRCRPVLFALSGSDRRRQAELDVGYHLLECEFCGTLSESLFDRRSREAADEARVRVQVDGDVVAARQRARDLAIHAGFSPTDATVIATAVSEIARNIVRFAERGELTMTVVQDDGAIGVMIVARDIGAGIADVDLALQVGYTTYGGRGLGLPGSRHLMDEFEITSEVGRGTTVTMTKWRHT
jgi:RNA polymerase sigma factor (sigma-70 family)